MKHVLLVILSLFFTSAEAFDQCPTSEDFNVGVGIHDITGPAAELGMMGYGMLAQKTEGLLQRLWARAFIIESPCNGKRIVFVNLDLAQVFQGITQQVIKKLKAKYGDTYSDENVLLTAIHSHSGPGGYSTYALYNLTTLGFNREHFNTIVDGIVAAITEANDHLTPAKIRIAKGELSGITYNRSPAAYLLNPPAERARYQNNIDTDMTLLRFEDNAGAPFAVINWFPVHGVSMNNKNHFIHGDNKGYAEYLFEKEMNRDRQGRPFVAAFAQSNAGDVSPNPLGHEGGAGLLGIAAVEKAGKPQYEKARTLLNQASETLKGGVDYRQSFVVMDEQVIIPTVTKTTCPAALGVSMLAGTQDGEGIGWQGMTCADMERLPFLGIVCKLVTTPCQGVKPIAIETGTMHPYPWTPRILPFQVIKIGQLTIVAAPFELTTMTGRRIKNAVAALLPEGHNTHIVLSTLSNAYAGYVATHEEYQLQRYEGASTHFGPRTEKALLQIFSGLTTALVAGLSVPAGIQPPDLLDVQTTIQTGVLFDDKPLGKQFGDIYQDVHASYQAGDTVTAIFWGGHPKNNGYPLGSFLTIEKLGKTGEWEVVKQDNDWDTSYHWERYGVAYSLVTITWRIPNETEAGVYRILHNGHSKSFFTNTISPYQGHSSVFTIT